MMSRLSAAKLFLLNNTGLVYTAEDNPQTFRPNTHVAEAA